MDLKDRIKELAQAIGADIKAIRDSVKLKYYADFLSSTNLPFVFTAISTGTTATTAITISPKHPGVYRITSSATANSGGRYQTDVTSILLSGSEEGVLIFSPRNLATLTLRGGFLDNINVTDAVDGVYFELTNGNLVFKTANNSSRSTSATVAALTSASWYKVVITLNANATTATIKLYDDSQVLLGTTSLSTNIPTASGRTLGFGIIATNSGTAITDLCDVDFLSVEFNLNR